MYSASSGTSNGFLEDIPIMISEQYQPTIYKYEVPQGLEKRLQYSDDIYQESSLFKYDFHYERKVLNDVSEFRRNRQLSKDRRNVRKLQREEEKRCRELELQQKKLASISYPSTEDLCLGASSLCLTENRKDEMNPLTESPISSGSRNPAVINNSFYNILQPIVLSQTTTTTTTTNFSPLHQSGVKNDLSTGNKNQSTIINSSNTTTTTTTTTTPHSIPTAIDSTFNFKDFESDTSSPFDNMELKTINDLDILAQVLHNSQLGTGQEPPKTNISHSSDLRTADNPAGNLFPTMPVVQPIYNGDHQAPSMVDNKTMDKLHLAS